MRNLILAALIVVLFVGCSQHEVNLMPKPQFVTTRGDYFSVEGGLCVESPTEMTSIVNYLKKLVEEWNSELPDNKYNIAGFPIVLELGEITSNDPEAYNLSVNKARVLIKGNTAKGWFYGFQTLKQLIKKENGQLMLRQAEIVDYPNFKWRSYMLDEARHFFGKDFVMRLLDELAALKINKFHWHLTDDAGWRIEINKYPSLTKIGAFRKDTEIETWGSGKLAGKSHSGYYTQDDIREVVEYARVRNIQVIPEIEMPGHASAAIAAYPWLGIIGEIREVPYKFGKLEDSYNISNPRVITFLHDVLDEVCKLFPSDVIHIGGDEVLFGTWSKSKEMQDYMKSNELNSPADAQIKFTNDISNYLESKGKRMMGWNEIMGKNVHNFENTEDYSKVKTALSKKSIIHFWRGEVELITEAAQNGYQIVNSLHTDTYLDYSYENSSLKHMYHFSPIPEGLEMQYEKNIIGVGTQMWTEWRPEYKDVEYQTFPRVAAIAEVAWSGAGDYDNFVNRLKEYSNRWIDKGINIPLDEIK